MGQRRGTDGRSAWAWIPLGGRRDKTWRCRPAWAGSDWLGAGGRKSARGREHPGERKREGSRAVEPLPTRGAGSAASERPGGPTEPSRHLLAEAGFVEDVLRRIERVHAERGSE